MSNVQELIVKLEKLTGPDREADVLIAAAIDWEGPLVHRPVSQFIKDMGGVSAVVKSFDSGGLNAFRYIPEYTSSIDAALPGEDIVVTAELNPHPDKPEEKKWMALQRGAKIAAYARTEALARRIAALRALSHKGASND